jgi:hypothetical protein
MDRSRVRIRFARATPLARSIVGHDQIFERRAHRKSRPSPSACPTRDREWRSPPLCGPLAGFRVRHDLRQRLNRPGRVRARQFDHVAQLLRPTSPETLRTSPRRWPAVLPAQRPGSWTSTSSGTVRGCDPMPVDAVALEVIERDGELAGPAQDRVCMRPGQPPPALPRLELPHKRSLPFSIRRCRGQHSILVCGL